MVMNMVKTWNICFLFMSLFLILCGCSDKKKPQQIKVTATADFKTEPAGAAIFIAGRTMKKTTPAKYPITPGVYVVKYSLAGYKTAWKRFEVKKGATVEVFEKLAPLSSSLLVAATADGKYGVQVRYKGKVMGDTPLVLRDLPVGKGELFLSKRGYAGRRVFFNVQDQLPPPAITTKLNSNMGRLSVFSDPDGAEVRLNGDVVGNTPLKGASVEDGHHKLEVYKNGYQLYVKDISIVRNKETRIPNIKLRSLPATLYVNAVPAGCKLFIDDQPKGDANGEAIVVAAGKHTIRLSKAGFDDALEEIVLKGGETRRINMRLDTVMGGLEIITRPAGVAVFVDGKLIGRSKADPANPKISQVITVPNMRQGKHTVTIAHKRARKPAGGRLTVTVNVKKGQITRVDQIELWVPDMKLVLKDGKTVEGRFLGKTAEGIYYEFRPGARYVHRYDLIERMEKLPVEDD